MKEEQFIASDTKKILCVRWDDVTKPKAIIQIVHGMNEHIRRYARVASFLNHHGYIVFGDDHRAHGKTARSAAHIGKADGEPDLFSAIVNDELEILKMLRQQYNLPVILFGHSYGSFIVQRCMELASGHRAAVLCGSAKYPYPALALCTVFATIFCKLKTPDADADLIERFSFRKRSNKKGTSWLTRDKKQIELYVSDPYCNKPFSYGFYLSLFKNLMLLHGKEFPNIDKKAPVLILSGGADAVGGNTIFVKTLYKIYRSALDNVELKIYNGARHELLNEINFEEVQNDLLYFFNRSVMCPPNNSDHFI